MKNLFFCLAALLLIGTTFSCEKDTPTPNNPDTPDEREAFFSVMLDGEAYIVDDGLRAYAYDLDGTITINGVADLDASETVVISMPDNFTTGTYQMSPNTYAIAIIDNISYTTNLPGGSGEVTITKYDGNKVEGTFQFAAIGGNEFEHELVATEGEFSVTLR